MVQIDGAECARVNEHETCCVLELEGGSSEPRKHVANSVGDPIAIHAEVHVDDASIVEMQELMLASPLDSEDACTSERTKGGRRESPLERRMKEPDAAKRTPLGVPAQRLHRCFNLGQFWHDPSREALTSLVRPTQTDAMPAAPQADERSLSANGRSTAVRRALMVVLALNAVSAALKVGVGARTGALTVLGAALESLLDMLSNGVGILAVSIASRAPDDDHPYGHEKFETLGTLGIVVFLSISCFELLRQSVGALVGAHRVPELRVGDALLLLASLGVNLFVVMYERRRGRELGSNLLLADAAHTASDILVTALAIASLVLRGWDTCAPMRCSACWWRC